jgi:hypothetical protein
LSIAGKVFTEHVDNGHRSNFALVQDPLEGRRVFEFAADVKTNQTGRQRQQERDAPAELGKLLRRENKIEDADDRRGHQQPDQRADLGCTGHQAAPMIEGGLCKNRCGAAELAAGGQALQQPGHEQQARRRHADGCVGRQQANRKGRQRHHDHGKRQCGLAAHAIADMSEHDAADRPGHECNRENRKRRQQAGGR